jgi:hypothetical protein
MKHIFVLSDTHGHIPLELEEFLPNIDEIWHIGDFGSKAVLDYLAELSVMLRCVYGNIDGQEIRKVMQEYSIFHVEGFRVLLGHILGYPSKYNAKARELIESHKPDIVLAGHSHILKVVRDQQLSHLHINPGAIGYEGFHQIRTMLSFTLDSGKIDEFKVYEYPKIRKT